MSLAFRVFLIMLLGALGLWGYRIRAPSLDRWFARGFTASEPTTGAVLRGRAGALPDLRLRVQFTGGTLPRPEPPEPSVGLDQLEDSGRAFAFEGTDSEIFEWQDPQPESEGAVLFGVHAGELEPPRSEANSTATDFSTQEDGSALDNVGAFAEAPPPLESSDELSGPGVEGQEPESDETDGVELLGEGPASSEPQAAVVHVVEAGETLWSIARAYYGTGTGYSLLMSANSELTAKRGERVRIGDHVRVPISDEMALTEESLKGEASNVDKPVEERSETVESPSQGGLHRVEKNETLSKIAYRYFPGDHTAWSRIFAANSETLQSPDLVIEGMLLKITPAAQEAE